MKTNESLGEKAHAAEKDHEVQMARGQLFKLAKYSIELHDLISTRITEEEGLEAWQQAKITKAAEYIMNVYDSLVQDEKVLNNINPDDQAVMNIAMQTQQARESTDHYKSNLHSKLKEVVAVSRSKKG
jgi:hypothetical protein